VSYFIVAKAVISDLGSIYSFLTGDVYPEHIMGLLLNRFCIYLVVLTYLIIYF